MIHSAEDRSLPLPPAATVIISDGKLIKALAARSRPVAPGNKLRVRKARPSG